MRSLWSTIASWTLIVTLLSSAVNPAKILLVPGLVTSHANFFSKSGKALQDAGHDVRVLVPQSQESIVAKNNVPALINHNEGDGMALLEPTLKKMMKGEDFFPRVLFQEIMPSINQYCENLLSNAELMREIEDFKFDLAVSDGVIFYSCLYMVPYKFDIPHITLSAMYNPWAFGVPALPSIEPSQLLSFTNRMSFFQRVATVLPYTFMAANPFSFVYSQSMMEKYLPEKPFKTFNQLMAESQLTLVNNDVMCSGFPRISTPGYHFIGGTSATPAKPLPLDLQQFADGAKDGLIVVSFGTVKALHSLWPIIKSKFMAALSRLPQRAIVQYALDDTSGVPDNVKLVKWLPQNDLVGHNNTKLFITHGGSNGQLEAIFHGVPLLTMPFSGDQQFNAGQAKERGLGITINRLTMTEEDIFSSIREVIGNPKYLKTVKRCSAIQRSMPTAQESLVFWVNHVLEFGGDHLRSPAVDMPMYQILMLDVWLFLALVVVLLIAIVVIFVRYLMRKCCANKKHKKE